MDITVIASGSNGNSTLVEDKDSSVLIDAGLSMKQIELRLSRMGKSLEGLGGVLVSHAHVDHYRSAGVISRRYGAPVFLSEHTLEMCGHKLGNFDPKIFKGRFKVGSMSIDPIDTSHDVPSTGFVIGKFGLFTDTGIVTPQMKKVVPRLSGLLLESNHDIDMLVKGPYPVFLKNRILSDHGHLSNISASQFIQDNANGLNWALLGHLSGNNNTTKLVKSTYETIVKKGIDYAVLSRDEEGGVWNL